jgi:hypothetical protein
MHVLTLLIHLAVFARAQSPPESVTLQQFTALISQAQSVIHDASFVYEGRSQGDCAKMGNLA